MVYVEFDPRPSSRLPGLKLRYQADANLSIVPIGKPVLFRRRRRRCSLGSRIHRLEEDKSYFQQEDFDVHRLRTGAKLDLLVFLLLDPGSDLKSHID